MVAEEAFQGRASRQLYGLEGRPLGEEVAEDGRIFVVEPLQHMWEIVLERTGEAIGDAYFVSDQAAAMLHELCEGAQGRTLGPEEGLSRSRCLSRSSRRSSASVGSSLALLGAKASRYRASMRGLIGKSTRNPRTDAAQRRWGPYGVRDRWQFGCPGNRVSKVLTTHRWCLTGVRGRELACRGARHLRTHIVFGISPVETDEEAATQL